MELVRRYSVLAHKALEYRLRAGVCPQIVVDGGEETDASSFADSSNGGLSEAECCAVKNEAGTTKQLTKSFDCVVCNMIANFSISYSVAASGGRARGGSGCGFRHREVQQNISRYKVVCGGEQIFRRVPSRHTGRRTDEPHKILQRCSAVASRICLCQEQE